MERKFRTVKQGDVSVAQIRWNRGVVVLQIAVEFEALSEAKLLRAVQINTYEQRENQSGFPSSFSLLLFRTLNESGFRCETERCEAKRNMTKVAASFLASAVEVWRRT